LKVYPILGFLKLMIVVKGLDMERRVVITGMGAITPIGNNVDEMWKGIEQVWY
jgi:hypothetical protein